MLNTKVKSYGNPTNQIGDPMKQVHMRNNKSFVTEMFYQFYLKVHPYNVDRSMSNDKYIYN